MRVLLCSPYDPRVARDHAAGEHLTRLIAMLSREVDLHVYWPWPNETECEYGSNELGGAKVALGAPQRYPGFSRHLGLHPASLRLDWPRRAAVDVLTVAEAIGASVVHAEYLQTGEVAMARNGRLAPGVVLGLHDVTVEVARKAKDNSSGPLRLYRTAEWARIHRFERRAVEASDAVVTLSYSDQETFEMRKPGRVLAALPPVTLPPKPWALPDPTRSRRVIVFSGAMWRHANELAAEYLAGQVMPRVWAEEPTAVLRIVGARPSERVRKLAQPERIEVTGEVADIRDELKEADVVAAPSFVGGGILMKVLDAMALGCPVVANDLAVRGVGEGRLSVVVANTASDMAGSLVALIRSSRDSVRIGHSAREYVRERHSSSQALDAYLKAYEIAAGRAS